MNFKKQYEEILHVSQTIFNQPELGYKEHFTKETILQFLLKVNPDIDIQEFSTTGMKTVLGGGKALNVAFIAELDAVYAPTHWNADANTGAAHNCGHYTQVAIALALYKVLFETKQYEAFDYTLTFVFIPAEEYLDLKYREELKRDNVITYYGGKPEAMKLGIFDDIDIGICVHAMGGEFKERTVEFNCNLAGFLYKKYTFKGKATHAGFDPFSAHNAYSMSTLFNTAVGLSRQQLKDNEMVRLNPIIMESDMSTNVIPNWITVGTDLRTQSVDYMQQVATRLDDAAKGSALALQGEVNIDTQMGYLPFVQDRYLSEFAMRAFDINDEIPAFLNNNAISAAGDIGDLSYMIPCIQIGHSGFTGTIHGDDFKDIDPNFILEVFPRYLLQVLEQMNGQLDKTKLYKRTYEGYESLIHSIAQI
ncbi:M20/M25/M40 family metallo-hydrolase [Paenibacillus macquariensis]|uniref:Amidohydrolase n=1 Tax=Paenibacillus macquariensis TaxID=948756 RepID=A0ABY1JPX2_9BACL|nr:M20/M25/M40 family metallo-hydrolase [Paenibacillus macquariensis]MEC0094039.1 carboxypeptidase [Paenibacillus macquariensis]OAB37505.1 carboxypeptidase [Paenibacillus macquariensis subsp. macquariensis]SIQ54979.1 amidohydrolase [Paenibacillus macquariensis]